MIKKFLMQQDKYLINIPKTVIQNIMIFKNALIFMENIFCSLNMTFACTSVDIHPSCFYVFPSSYNFSINYIYFLYLRIYYQ